MKFKIFGNIGAKGWGKLINLFIKNKFKTNYLIFRQNYKWLHLTLSDI